MRGSLIRARRPHTPPAAGDDAAFPRCDMEEERAESDCDALAELGLMGSRKEVGVGRVRPVRIAHAVAPPHRRQFAPQFPPAALK